MTDSGPVAAPAPALVEELPTLEDIGRDFELLSKRIATKKRALDNGQSDVPMADVLGLQFELCQLIMDHLSHTKTMEDHAEWATEAIEELQEDAESTSQLTDEDATTLREFTQMVLAKHDVEGDPLREKATEVLALIEEIVLKEDPEADGDPEDDDEEPETPSAPS